jgi:uncharacterized membrane protein
MRPAVPFLVCFVIATSAGAQQFAVRTVLIAPLKGYAYTGPVALNDEGQIVGNAGSQDGMQRDVFVWTREQRYRIVAHDAEAADINNNGDVVGFRDSCSYTPDLILQCSTWGFLWNEKSGLRNLPDGFSPRAIADSGDMAGKCVRANGQGFTACAIRAGSLTVFEDVYPCSYYSCDTTAAGINANGDVVGGLIDDEDPHSGGVLWPSEGGEVPLALSGPVDINDAGAIAGTSFTTGDSTQRPAAWINGTLVRAPVMTGYASAVNQAGLIVGRQFVPDADGNYVSHAFLWNPTTGSIEILGVRYKETHAVDVNNAGQVLGAVARVNGSAMVIWHFTPKGPLYIQTPNDPAQWGIGTRQRLAWTYSGTAGSFLVELSRDGGAEWESLGRVGNKPGRSQNFWWTVTASATSAARLRVTAVGDEADDINDSPIKIAPVRVDVVSPLRTTRTYPDEVLTIFFKHNLGANQPYAVDVSRDGGQTWRHVGSARTSGTTTSRFLWTVDEKATPNAAIKVRALRFEAVGVSAVFQIHPELVQLTLTGELVDMWDPISEIFPGIALGTPYTAILTYDPRHPDLAPDEWWFGAYSVRGTLRITAAGRTALFANEWAGVWDYGNSEAVQFSAHGFPRLPDTAIPSATVTWEDFDDGRNQLRGDRLPTERDARRLQAFPYTRLEVMEPRGMIRFDIRTVQATRVEGPEETPNEQ